MKAKHNLRPSTTYEFLSDIIIDMGYDWRPYLAARPLVKSRILSSATERGIKIVSLPRRAGHGLAVASYQSASVAKIIRDVIQSDESARALLRAKKEEKKKRAEEKLSQPNDSLNLADSPWGPASSETEVSEAYPPAGYKPDPAVALAAAAMSEELDLQAEPEQSGTTTNVGAQLHAAELALMASAFETVVYQLERLTKEVAELRALWNTPTPTEKDDWK